MKSLDIAGTYIGTIVEEAVGETAKGFPQYTAKLLATKKFVGDKETMAHFQITEPAYVDWTSYDEGITAFLVLFNDNGPLKNYEQLVAAIGWAGTSFDDINGLGKSILFRVEEDTYNGKTQLKVNWIDHPEAPPERTLKQADPEKIKGMNSRFLSNMVKPAAPAKPVTAAKPAFPSPKVPAAAATTATAPTTTTTPTTPQASSATPAPAPKRQKKPPVVQPAEPVASAPPLAAPPVAAPAATLPPVPTKAEGCTKMEAWEFVNSPAVKGTNDDDVITDAWIAATSEVGADVDEEKFTPEMWAKVREIIAKDMKA